VIDRPPGLIVLFGSGEVSAEAQPVHDYALKRVSPPVRAAVVETPAGFEPNSGKVAGRLADFLKVRLQNYRPDVTIVPARKRGTSFSPDDPAIVAPLLTANYLMMGPGSPSYAVRQLSGSLTWQTMIARHRLGYPLIFASAATIASSAFAIPVYEIYKVGEDPHWKKGLDLFGPYGARVAFVPHWDNHDGGDDLDTSRCFLGESRFETLHALLPADVTIIGIDEKTALVIDFANDECRVMGAGGASIVGPDGATRLVRRASIPLRTLGLTTRPSPSDGIPRDIWESAVAAEESEPAIVEAPNEVLALVEARTAARANRDWAAADRLRGEIGRLGWQVNDLPGGAQLVPSESNSST
jgi:hypothetical protein